MLILPTGQTTCHDVSGKQMPCEGSGQDAELGHAFDENRFEQHGETVRDTATGLTWLKNANAAQFPLPWDEAREFCETLDTAGRSWRLPSRRELASLVSFGAAGPALPEGHPFSEVFSGWYWSATPSALKDGYFWRVQLSGGRMFHGASEDACMVWPVSGESPELVRGADENDRFEAVEDTVHDTATGLVWLRKADLCGPVLWEEALDHVRELTEETGHPWRLPNIRELESLAQLGHAFPALAPGHPFADLQEVYWSSTSSSFEHDWAMAYYQHKGALGVGFKAGPERFFVWPVKNAT